MSPYYRRALNVYELGSDDLDPGAGVFYVRASSADKAERICKALNTLAKAEATNAACGWPVEWAPS